MKENPFDQKYKAQYGDDLEEINASKDPKRMWGQRKHRIIRTLTKTELLLSFPEWLHENQTKQEMIHILKRNSWQI
jgi:hypothetical protein